MIKVEFYRYVKIAGFFLFIPITLATGPLVGYFLGDFLVKQFKFNFIIVYILICLGFLAGIFETIRIIKLTMKV